MGQQQPTQGVGSGCCDVEAADSEPDMICSRGHQRTADGEKTEAAGRKTASSRAVSRRTLFCCLLACSIFIQAGTGSSSQCSDTAEDDIAVDDTDQGDSKEIAHKRAAAEADSATATDESELTRAIVFTGQRRSLVRVRGHRPRAAGPCSRRRLSTCPSC